MHALNYILDRHHFIQLQFTFLTFLIDEKQSSERHIGASTLIIIHLDEQISWLSILSNRILNMDFIHKTIWADNIQKIDSSFLRWTQVFVAYIKFLRINFS